LTFFLLKNEFPGACGIQTIRLAVVALPLSLRRHVPQRRLPQIFLILSRV
jgi:hypothetical protein